MKIHYFESKIYHVTFELNSRELNTLRALFQNCPTLEDEELVNLYKEMFLGLGGKAAPESEDETPF